MVWMLREAGEGPVGCEGTSAGLGGLGHKGDRTVQGAVGSLMQ